MIDSLQSLPSMLAILGIVLLTIEVAILGFSTLFLIFVSAACFGTALLMKFGVLPESVWAAIGSVAVQSGIWAAVLWRPLKKLQNTQQAANTQRSAFDGESFRLETELSSDASVSQKYSGVDWALTLDPACTGPIPAGTEMVIVKAEVGRLIVKPKAA